MFIFKLGLQLGADVTASSGGSGVARLPPSGFPVTPPFNITYNGGVNYTTDYNIGAAKPAYAGTIFCGAGGANTNDGLTYATRVRSWKSAVGLANALAISLSATTIRIQIDDGLYKNGTIVSGVADAWGGLNPTCNLVIEVNMVNGVGRAINCMDTTVAIPSAGFTVSSDPNIYKASYTTAAPTRTIVDRANLDSDGMPTMLGQVRTVVSVTDPTPEINAMFSLFGIGAMFLDTTNKVIWVRRVGNIAPDANMIILGGNTGAGFQTSPAASLSIWMQDCSFWGGSVPFKMQTTSAQPLTLWGNRIHYLGGNSTNAFNWNGGPGTCIHVASAASYADQDGWNYHGAASAGSAASCPQFYELSCTGRWNGWDGGGINNDTTSHEFCQGVRVMGNYSNAADRSVNDIVASQTWNLGCISSTRRGLDTTENSSALAMGTGAASVTSTCFYDGCTAGVNYAGAAAQFPYECYSTGSFKYANMGTITPPSGAPGAGTFATYVP